MVVLGACGLATTGTMLFTIDSSADMLNLQNPPNGGTQTNPQTLGVNAVGVLTGFEGA